MIKDQKYAQSCDWTMPGFLGLNSKWPLGTLEAASSPFLIFGWVEFSPLIQVSPNSLPGHTQMLYILVLTLKQLVKGSMVTWLIESGVPVKTNVKRYLLGEGWETYPIVSGPSSSDQIKS